jgi:hypothetical protein
MIHVDTVGKSLDERLRPGLAQQTLLLSVGELACELDLEKADALACVLTRLQVMPAAPPSVPLTERSQTVASRITGLMEPLRVVEVDAPAAVAQLRSLAPATVGDGRAYYELLLETSGRATLHRYVGKWDGPRQTIPFTLTREALAKLIVDLAS